MSMQPHSSVDELRHLLTQPVDALKNHSQNSGITVSAYAALEALRDSGDENFLFLRSILELTQQQQQQQQHLQSNEELLFHCITGCRQVYLWQWNKYSPGFVHILRDYFMLLGHQLATISRTCRLACYTTSVSFWKRSWNDGREGNGAFESTTTSTSNFTNHELPIVALIHATSLPLPSLTTQCDLFQYLEELFQRDMQTASHFLSCLVTEFCGKSAVSYRLPLEFHKQVHRTFERHGGLNHSVKLAMTALSRVVTSMIDEPNSVDMDQSLSVVNVTTDVIGWEFGMSAWDTGNVGAAALASSRKLIRAPMEWKDYFARTDVVEALYRVHHSLVSNQQINEKGDSLAHGLRQLILQLASLSGPLLGEVRQHYASTLCHGTLQMMQIASALKMEESSTLLDAFQITSRIICNFRISILNEIPTFAPLLHGLTSIGKKLLEDHVSECESTGGDIESMLYFGWREEVLALILDCAVQLCSDVFLLYSGNEESRKAAQISLSSILGSTFEGFVRCRTRMAALEEQYHVSNEIEFDEVRDVIMEADLMDEMDSIATIGRLNLPAALACWSSLFATTMPRLHTFWESSKEVTPEASALLEEARLLLMFVCHLLTDENDGESPSIPEAVLESCRVSETVVEEVSIVVQRLFQLANSQVQRITKDPSNRHLSPLLANTFLWFLNRWAPAYIYPCDFGQSYANCRLIREWSNSENATQVIHFSIHMCFNYQCFWPQEKSVQESAVKLLLSLSKRGNQIRTLIVGCPVFHDLVRFHSLTAGVLHSTLQSEFEAAIRVKCGDNPQPSIHMIWGYHRLPYKDKAHILTAVLVACSDSTDDVANAMINSALSAVLEAFTSFLKALATNQTKPEDIHSKETACLCVEMFCGIAQASEMAHPERIPLLLSSYLPQLSSLMNYYAKDLTLCETLLRFFLDYTAHFISLLDRTQSLVLFQASAELLKSYSSHHVASRAIKLKSTAEAEAEEEQAYNDILTATQLLINLGTKDFIDLCVMEGIESSQVTDMIFFGLQQLLPLMTRGLLQFPTLCSVFFDLISFMMETYPNKVCELPYDLLNALLDSLLFGMSHLDPNIGIASLQGLASITREHLSNGALKTHLQQHPDIFDHCSRRLLSEVVFQTVVVDRVEAAGMALLPLVAIDVSRFAGVVQNLSLRISNPQHKARLDTGFSKLMQPEVLAKVAVGGTEDRMNRVKFKRNFEDFVNEVHVFLVIK